MIIVYELEYALVLENDGKVEGRDCPNNWEKYLICNKEEYDKQKMPFALEQLEDLKEAKAYCVKENTFIKHHKDMDFIYKALKLDLRAQGVDENMADDFDQKLTAAMDSFGDIREFHDDVAIHLAPYLNQIIKIQTKFAKFNKKWLKRNPQK